MSISLISTLSFVLSAHINAQSANKPLLANQLFASGNYYDAITEYKRYIYLYSDNEMLDSIYFQIALSYRYSGDIANSNMFFAKSLAATASEETAQQIKIGKAINSLIAGDIENASAILHGILNLESNSEIAKLVRFYLSFANMLKGNYKEAYENYNDYLRFYDESSVESLCYQDRMLNTLDSLQHVRLKNPGKARLFSMFIPGAGQAYCNDYFNGINAFLLNGSLLFMVGKLISAGSYLDAAVFSVILSIFYRGNLFRSEQICNKVREKQVDEINKLLFDHFLKSCNGDMHEGMNHSNTNNNKH